MFRKLDFPGILLVLIFSTAAKPSVNELQAIDFLNKTNINYIADIEKFKVFVLRTRFIQSFPINGVKNGILMRSYPDPERLDTFSYESFENQDIKRQLQILRRKGLRVLNRQHYVNATYIMETLRSMYGDKFVCFRNESRGCNKFNLQDLVNLSYLSDDPENILHYWKMGRNASKGIIAMVHVNLFANLFRKAAVLNGYKTAVEMWNEDFEDDSLQFDLEEWISELKPLYLNLHAYIRRALQDKYKELFEESGAIPQHLLGEIVFRATSHNLDKTYLPYPEQGSGYFDQLLKTKNHKFKDNLNMSITYFESMGMMPLNQNYFNEHCRVHRSSRNMFRICKSEHFDLDSDVVFRFCANQDFSNFIHLHGEMAIMQYAMHKSKLPVGLNRQPCPGFSNALAKAVSLSAMNFQYLQIIGMPVQYSFAEELHLNMLLYLAVETLFPLMEEFVLNKLWQKILEGELEPNQYNCYYWLLMEKYAGLEPPQYRSDVQFDVNPMFFDIFEERPAAKVFSKVFGFHVYKKLCEVGRAKLDAADDSLFCTFYGNKNIGDKLSEIMSLGSRRNWRDILALMGGSRDVDASAILSYFDPLKDWLLHLNVKKRINVGWIESLKCDVVSSYFEDNMFA